MGPIAQSTKDLITPKYPCITNLLHNQHVIMYMKQRELTVYLSEDSTAMSASLCSPTKGWATTRSPIQSITWDSSNEAKLLVQGERQRSAIDGSALPALYLQGNPHVRFCRCCANIKVGRGHASLPLQVSEPNNYH